MPITLWYIIQDGKGDKTRLEIPIADGIDLDSAWAAVSAFAYDFGQLIMGGIVDAGMTVGGALLDDSVLHPFTESDLQERAAFVFRSTGGTRRMTIPTFNEAFFVPNSHQVDVTNELVAGFLTAMLSGEGAAVPTDIRGDDLIGLMSAVEDWGKPRNRTGGGGITPQKPNLLVNGSFEAWTNDNPDGWLVTESVAGSQVTQEGDACRIISTGNPVALQQNVLTAGLQYTLEIVVSEVNVGISVGDASNPFRLLVDEPGRFSQTFIATEAVFIISRRLSTTNTVIESVTVRRT